MAYITAIRLGPGDAEEHIVSCSVLYPEHDGKTYQFNPKSIVELMDKGQKFYVGSSNGAVEVVAVRRPGKDPYIRTKADNTFTNNLLSLPYIR